jgi:hypothetical protein
MMDDMKFGQAASLPDPHVDNVPQAAEAGEASSATPAVDEASSPALERFRSCRWRAAPEEGAYCTHRDVLPFAGKDGFNADSWCPECSFYKLRRTPKKRERVDYMY